MNKPEVMRKIVETVAYVLLAAGAASGMVFLLRPPLPDAQRPTVARSDADALLLRSALDIPSGKVAIIEFMDFQCPPCRASYPRIEAVLKSHPDVAYRPVNFPLNIHVFAFGAAVASEIAKAHGQHDMVFEDMFTGKTDIDPDSLNKYLGRHHLPAIVGKGESEPFKVAVRNEMRLADNLKIHSTPTILVMGRNGTLTEVHGLGAVPDLLN